MKNIVKKCICTVISAVLLFSAAAAPLSAEDERAVKVGFYSMPGLQSTDENGKPSGYLYDYLQEIAKHTGWKYDFYTGDFADCLAKLENGEIDIMGGLQKTQERLERFDYPNYSCGEMYTALYVKEDDFSYAYGDTESFEGMRVGVLKGLAGNNDFYDYCKKNNFTVNVTEFDSEHELLSALENGAVEAICTLSTQTTLRCIAGFSYKNFYFMATKGTQLIAELDRALENIKVQNPFYEKDLWEQYFPVEKETTPVYTKAEKEYIKNAGNITAVYNKSMIPLEIHDEKTGEFSGITAGIFQLISEMSGLNFCFIAENDYDAAYEKLKNENVQIICSTARDYEWAEMHNAKISREYLNMPIVMVSKNRNANDIAKVALPKGLYLTHLIETNFKNYEYIEYPSSEDCFEAVSAGAVDATFANTYLAREYLKDSKYSDMKAVALNGYTIRYCIGFSNDADDLLLSVIDKTLACISDDQINELVVATTMTYNAVTPIDLIYQNPIESVLLIAGVFGLFILLLIVILRGKMRYAKKLYFLLNLDSLTNAPSFTKFRRDARGLIANKSHPPYILLYFNISKFKDINDMYGYTAGDELLKRISDKIKSTIFSGELFARMYSDRFILLLTYKGIDEFQQRYESFIAELAKTSVEKNMPRSPHFTAGAYVLTQEDEDINLAIDRACYAHEQCYAETAQGCVFYDEELNKKILTQRMLEADMEEALANGDFLVYYQPKINSKTEALEGCEALIRWQHKTAGLIPPSVFVPVFEKNGFIIKTDYFVFEQVCQYLAKQKNPTPVSCNFSRLHLLNAAFPDELAKTADSYGINRALLEIEITETIAVNDIDIAKNQLKRLQEKGFLISIDDFGAGYSSLGILSEIPFDIIKLDRSLIYNAVKSEENRLILSGIIKTIQSLHKKIVCEGVEEQAQIDLLQSFGCYTIQGYFYSKPLPKDEFVKKFADTVKEK